jgi:lipoate-protein ligase A
MQQLRLEEALLRSTSRSWFVVGWEPRSGAEEDDGEGAADAALPLPLAAKPTGDAPTSTDNNSQQQPTIVLGISGKPAELIDLPLCVGQPNQQPAAIRRFSGGGTVVVGPGAVLTSLIVSREDLERRKVDPFPHPLMRWTAQVYARAFDEAARGARRRGGSDDTPTSPPRLSLNENDYCFGDLKIAGNAQAITGGRALHHTSFLWDWQEEHMRLLLSPKRQPEYRRKRAHGAFLTRVREVFPEAFPRPQDLAVALEEAVVEEWGGEVEEADPQELARALRGNHLPGNRWVDLRREALAAAALAAATSGTT